MKQNWKGEAPPLNRRGLPSASVWFGGQGVLLTQMEGAVEAVLMPNSPTVYTEELTSGFLSTGSTSAVLKL